MPMPALRISHIECQYRGVAALSDVSLEVPAGGLAVVLGANGAGKTTLLRAVSGLVCPTAGRIELNGQRLDQLEPDAIVRLGVSHVPEGRPVFGSLTVHESLLLGGITRPATEIPAQLARVGHYFPMLLERARQPAATLSGGERQMLAIAQALMARPRVLLLDEPSLGLSPLMIARIFAVIRQIRAGGCTVLLVEQNARQAMQVADYVYVLAAGRLALSGTPAELATNQQVEALYLGG